MKKNKFIPITVIIKNTGKETAYIVEARNGGVTVYVLDKSGNRTVIFPKGPYDGSAGALVVAPGESQSIEAGLPVEVINKKAQKLVVSVLKMGDADTGEKGCIAFSSPFTLPALR